MVKLNKKGKNETNQPRINTTENSTKENLLFKLN